jgi:hypothetical protein
VTQPLDVAQQVRGRVGGDFAVRGGVARAPLIEQHDAEKRRVEKPPVLARAAATRPAMQKQHRHAARVAAGLPVHRVNFVQRQHAAVVGFDGRVQLGTQGCGGVHAWHYAAASL